MKMMRLVRRVLRGVVYGIGRRWRGIGGEEWWGERLTFGGIIVKSRGGWSDSLLFGCSVGPCIA